MEEFFSLKYGLAGVCVLLTFIALERLLELLWRMREKKDDRIDETLRRITEELEANTKELRVLQTEVSSFKMAAGDVTKLKVDLQRFYSAVKAIAGDRWPQIRDEIMKDRFTV